MSFWESDLGEITGNAADAFAKQFTQIPDGTMALARIDSFVNAVNDNGMRYLNIDWVLTGGDFKGQKVNQKLKVYDADPMDKNPDRTRHRALNMFKLIFQLYKLKPTHAGEPTDKDLSVFLNKEAGIKIRETEPNANGKQYNWVAEIHEAKGFVCETGNGLPVSKATYEKNTGDTAFSRNQNSGVASVPDDDIPF